MSWIAVAKKEYLENVRNAWVVTVSLVFLAITLLTAWLVDMFIEGSGPPNAPVETFTAVVTMLSAMQSFGGFLPPILALMLGFATLAGERESGSLGLLVAQPLSRTEIVLGKWLGLWGVLATSVLIGYGLGGIWVVARLGAGALEYQALLVFLLLTLAWTAAWTSLTLLVSAFFARRGTAIAGSIGVWFLFGSFVWTMLTFALIQLTVGTDAFVGNEEIPAWLVVTQVLNPNQVYDGILTASIEGFGISFDISGMARTAMRDVYRVGLFATALAAWIVVPLVGAIALFRRRDI